MLNGRVLRELTVVLLIAGALDQLVQIELKGNDNLVNVHSLARLGVNLADPAQHGAAGQNLSRTARLQKGIALALDGTEADLLDAQLGEQLLDNALAKEETQLAVLHVPGLLAPLAREHTRHGLGLLGQAGVLATVEQAADLVQMHVRRAVGLVVGHRLQQTRQQRAAHLGLLGHQRVHEHHGATAALGGHTDLLQVARGGKAKSRGLVEAAGAQDLTDLTGELLLAGQAADVVLGSRDGRRHAAHAPQAQDLLDQIDLARQVGAEAGRSDHKVLAVTLDGAAQAGERTLDKVGLDVGTADGVHAGQAQLNAVDGLGRGENVDIAGSNLAAGDLLDERAGNVGDIHAASLVNLALKANGGVGDQRQIAAGVRGATGVKAGALDHHVDGVVLDLGIHAAHNAGQRHGALAVGDEAHAGVEHALLAIERRKLLVLLGGANHHAAVAVALGKGRQVKGMQRLTGEHHHVVGDVDDVVVRTHAQGVKALDHPVGRRADLHVAHDAGDIAVAQALVGNLDGKLVVGRAASLRLDGGQLHVEIAVENGTGLAGHADHGQAIGTVGRDLAVEHGVARAHILGKRHAAGRILGQDHDAGVVAAQTELARGAVHAHGHDAAQLALLDLDVAGQLGTDHGRDDVVAGLKVLRAADNLQRSGVAVGVEVLVAHVDRAHIHMVAIGVRGLGEHLGGHHMVEGLAHGVDRLDLGAGTDIFVRKGLGILRNIDHGLEPVVRNTHLALLSY